MNFKSSVFGSKLAVSPVSKIDYETDDFDATESMLESLIVMEDRFLEISRENLTAVHYGVREQSLEILNEGLSDIFKSSIEFFKRMIDKFKEMMNRLFMMINAYIGNFERFLTRYKTELGELDPQFTINGFNYSIDGNIPDLDIIKSIVSSFNGEISDVPGMTKLDIMKEREEFTSDTYMDRMRAKVIKESSPIASENYLSTLQEKFRSGAREEVEINVNKSVLSSTISGYSELKKTHKDCAQHKDRVILLIESMKQFFSRGTSSVYSGQSKAIQTHTISINDDGSAIVKGESSNVTDNLDNSEKLNLFYSYKLKQSKELGSIAVMAVTEKTNALKQAVRQSEQIIRKAIFTKNKPSDGGEV